MRIVAIDPGCAESAWLVYEDGNILMFGKDNNQIVLDLVRALDAEHLAIEMIQSFGMAVGREVFETCVWIGRFVEAWGKDYTFIYRKDVKMHLCQSPRAKDANIRAALIDRFGPAGSKKSPGVTYGISKDVWSALAVACVWSDTHQE